MSDGVVPIFDGHNDMLLRLASGGTFLERDATGHLDLPRARAGGMRGGFCAVFVRSPGPDRDAGDILGASASHPAFPPTPAYREAHSAAVAGMARLFRLCTESRGAVEIVSNADDIERCVRDNVFAALLHLEGAEAIDPDFDALHLFHRAGLRSLGPVWSRPNSYGHGVPYRFPHSPDTGPGLTERGMALVRACNDLRILVDVSHLTERGFWDVARVSTAPLVATHSNVHAISAATRNLADRQLDAIRDSDGMVGVNFCVGFLREDGAPRIDTPLDTLVRHIDYLVERIGIDRVGFGSDFDGAMIPEAIGDASGLPNLIAALRHAGYVESELLKLGYRNWVRVLRHTWDTT